MAVSKGLAQPGFLPKARGVDRKLKLDMTPKGRKRIVSSPRPVLRIDRG